MNKKIVQVSKKTFSLKTIFIGGNPKKGILQ